MMIIMMVLIFGLSNQPTEESNRLSNAVGTVLNVTPQHEWQDQSTTPILLGLNIRKIAHIGLYCLMGITAMAPFLNGTKFFSYAMHMQLLMSSTNTLSEEMPVWRTLFWMPLEYVVQVWDI